MFSFKKKIAAYIFLPTLGFTSFVQASDNILEADGFNVSVEDFEQYSKAQLPESGREAILAQEQKVRQLVQNLYVIRALATEAKEDKTVDMEKVDWAVDFYRERLLMEEHLNSLVDAEIEKINFETSAKEYYQANTDEFKIQERVRAQHILISTSERSEEDALAIANAAHKKLKDGVEFVKVVAEYSDDPSAAKNLGTLGFFGRGQMVKPFEEKAFSMDLNEISEPVKTRFGYHIIMVLAKEEAGQKKFDDVKSFIVNKLKTEKMREIRQSIISDVSTGDKDFGLKLNEKLLKELEEKYSK
ncbi:peptidylprolyl isomerase [Marinobacterium marinum]|uniref:peptidylprolyl isomerase n=1 Tax=Marinobacterium marinum TaxID=2756129 RepID=A0A7W2AB32_9GAMM|nr:peptidylprolyl isomerase [Marinobacterium marinum]MBA4500999.1 peptidylprolyl isomerase [Marinobacterium marinum]